MKAILVEDELKSQLHLSRLLERHCPEITLEGIATNIAQAYELVTKCKPELIFLDIELGKENGFTLLQQMREHKLNSSVIFTTAHEKYGIRAIKFSALDYLLKPVKEAELVSAVEKAGEIQLYSGKNKQIDHLLELLNLRAGQEQTIAIPLSRELRFVKLADIIEVCASNNYSIIHLENKETLTVSKGIFNFEKLLTPAGFIRVHQSHIINIRFVKALKKKNMTHELELINGTVVPISRLRVEQVKAKLLKKRD